MQKKKILRYAFFVFLAIFISIGTFFALLFVDAFGKIHSKTELRNLKSETATLVYSHNNQLIGKFFSQNRTNVQFDSIPKSLVEALIATEDARFYEHEGVDARSMLRVLIKTVVMGNRSSGGGSTLSQQLAKNLFGRNKYGKVSIYVNKFKEIILAYRIEEAFSKNEIIELYLNTVPFGENLYGIESASQRFFNKSSAKLKTEESAVLIGLLKANSYYNPRSNPEQAKNRRQIVISQMEKYGYLNKNEKDSLQALPLKLDYANLSRNNPAPYFLERVKREVNNILSQTTTSKQYDLEKDGLIIKTTIDLDLHRLAQKAIAEQLSKMQALLRKQYQRQPYSNQLQSIAKSFAKQKALSLKDDKAEKRAIFQWNEKDSLPSITAFDSLKHILTQLQAGFLAMDPNIGAIRSWIGGINFQHYPFDQVLAKRQIASTFKPILCAAAIENGAKVCDYLSNESVVLSDYEGWSPQNYDGESGGEYSLAAALAKSKNIPTLHIYFHSPCEGLEELWIKMGFIEKLTKDPSVILGSNSASIFEVAIAYSSFANEGEIVDPYLIESIKSANGELIYQRKPITKTRVLEKETARIINEILIKATKEGTGAALTSKYGMYQNWAGKTGTSQNYADAWYVGYNRQMLMVSRVGASYPAIHFDSGNYGSGSRLALPIVGSVLANSKKSNWYRAGLAKSNKIDCEDYRELGGLKKFFNSFKSDQTTLEKEQKKAEKKKNRKGLFKRIFGN